MDIDLLTRVLDEHKQPAFRQRQIVRAVRHELKSSWSEISNVPKALRAALEEQVPFSTVTVEHEEASTDGSVKLRLATADGFPLEAVLMRFDQPHAKGTDKKTSR